MPTISVNVFGGSWTVVVKVVMIARVEMETTAH
jgi:hypothetical protein